MPSQSGAGTTVAEDAVAALRAALGDRLVAVVLFGSRARGDARPDSDWDLLVVAEGLPPGRFERHVMLHKLPLGLRGGAVSILAKTAEEFEGHLPALYLDIALDGKALYDPYGYMAERLASLRTLIDRAGLYRRRTPAGDVWRFREQPKGHWSLQWEI